MVLTVTEVTFKMTVENEGETEIVVLLPKTKFVSNNFVVGMEFSSVWKLGVLIEESAKNLVQQVQGEEEALALLLRRIPVQALYDIFPQETFGKDRTYQIKEVKSLQLDT